MESVPRESGNYVKEACKIFNTNNDLLRVSFATFYDIKSHLMVGNLEDLSLSLLTETFICLQILSKRAKFAQTTKSMLLILAPICHGRARRKRKKERNEQALHEPCFNTLRPSWNTYNQQSYFLGSLCLTSLIISQCFYQQKSQKQCKFKSELHVLKRNVLQ